MYFNIGAECIELSALEELDAELSAVRVFVAFDGGAGFVAHAIPKGWCLFHLRFGLEGFDVLGGSGRRVRN